MEELTPMALNTATLELLDRLQLWKNALAEPEQTLPTVQDIEWARERLRVLQREGSDQLQGLAASLDGLVGELVERHQEATDAGLARLESLSGLDPEWRTIREEVQGTLGQMEGLMRSPEDERRRRRDVVTVRLEGEEILHKARQDQEETLERLRKDEEAGERTLVQDAQALWHRMREAHQQAQGSGVAPEVLSELRVMHEESKAFWDLKRKAYEGVLTADEDDDYEQVMEYLRFVQSQEGPSGQVLYPSSIDPANKEAAPRPVAEAIAICEKRWGNFLAGQARAHIDEAAQLLEDGDPPAAEAELHRIVGEDKLPDGAKHQLRDVREKLGTELSEFRTFERGVRAALEQPLVMEGWRSLVELGEQYKRFQSRSTVWRTGRHTLSQKVAEDVQQTLLQAAEAISLHSLDQAAEVSKGVKADLSHWPSDFSEAREWAQTLSLLAAELMALLPRADDELRKRQLAEASETLCEIRSLLEDARSRLPEPLAVPLEAQAEAKRLNDMLDSYERADELYERLHSELTATEQVSHLPRLAAEIEGHLDRVADEYRPDFAGLLEYTRARYAYFAGRSILVLAGDPEQAKGLLEKAATHEEFQAKAKAEIADIEQRLIPANEAVSRALSKIEQEVALQQFWQAYRTAISVASEPAQKSLREKLEEQVGITRQKSHEESLRALHSAVSSGAGDPSKLREHARRLGILDPPAMEKIAEDVWLLVYALEADAAVQQADWDKAHHRFTEALKACERSQQPAKTAQVGSYRTAAAASWKQHLLDLSDRLSPEFALEVLQQDVSGRYEQDPDLHLATARSHRGKAEEAEESDMYAPEEHRTDQMTMLQTVRQDLLAARSSVVTARGHARRWLIPDRRPSYEARRAEFIGIDPETLSEQRNARIDNERQQIRSTLRLNSIKLSITRLLPRPAGSHREGG